MFYFNFNNFVNILCLNINFLYFNVTFRSFKYFKKLIIFFMITSIKETLKKVFNFFSLKMIILI